ncbi:Hypothetical protein NocV09_00401340 [Nannochloropsis oceanica]
MDEGDSLTVGNTSSTATTVSSSLSTSGSLNNNNARRRPQYFFRTADSSTANESSPRLEGNPLLSEGVRLLLWSLCFNSVTALLVLGLVETIVVPVLLATLELTPSPRMSKLLTAVLTAVLFQGGWHGSIVLLLAVGGAAVGLVMAQWDDGFVPMFIFMYVGLWTFLRAGSSGGDVGGLLGSLGRGPPLSTASGAVKGISDIDSTRGEGPLRWRGLWGA